jgi:type IV secretion system protein VirB6
VVAVGPLMVLGILFRATQEYFTKWVSYAVQFAVLAMFVGGVAGITSGILDHYIAALETPGDTVDLNTLLAPVIILLILAWIFGQLPNMASSLSGGIGLAVGNTAWNGIRRATAGTLHHAGGKHLDAWRDAARWRRVRRAEALHESAVALRRRVQDRLLHDRNEVTATATAGTKSLQQQAREHVEARRRRRAGG